MSQLDVTKFVNIDDEDFTGYYNRSQEPNGWTVKAGEERMLVVAMAETFAKHLLDRVLSKKGVKDTLKDSPLRRSFLAKILPELPEKNSEVKKLSPEEEREELKKILALQAEQIKELKGEVSAVKEGKDSKDELIEQMAKELTEIREKLEQAKPDEAAEAPVKRGRPKKSE